MAVDFPFKSIFLCERVLQEKQDDVLSAIRLVDAFVVPKERTDTFLVQFTLVLQLKSLAPIDPAGYRLTVTLIRSTGEREGLIESEIIHPESKFTDPSIPWGVGAVVPVKLLVRNLGTAYLEIDINGSVVSAVPFTITEPLPEPISK